ncbi:MAG: aminotransferase [Clostridia bacterium]|nr:aminotransferase [Clostridia bacterium]
MVYTEASIEVLQKELQELKEKYNGYKADPVRLDMTRGKPGADQLDLCEEMLRVIGSNEDCKAENGLDCRNYGILDGIPEAKKLFADLLEVQPEQVIVGGNSSLNMMYDTICRAYCFGEYNSERPWSKEEQIKFLCPAPGYDRHFSVCKQFDIQMIPIPMNEDGPDMEMIESLVAEDASVKGIWCVPKYSNPTGIVYSDGVVRRFAALKPKAPDFRIFWDNAYAVHDLYEEHPELLNLLDECEKAGNPDMVYEFTSTSKISYPGSGVAVMASGKENIANAKKWMNAQTIGPDKLNQLRHIKMFKDKEAITEQMKKHAAILRPKFETVLSVLERDLGACGIASWSKPLGGYFISFDALPGCAKRIAQLCAEAGVALTPAGATYPYGVDPEDRNIRIAPSFPPIDELKLAVERFTVCVRIASIEKILADR